MSFSPEFYSFTVFRFFQGIFNMQIFLAAFVMGKFVCVNLDFLLECSSFMQFNVMVFMHYFGWNRLSLLRRLIQPNNIYKSLWRLTQCEARADIETWYFVRCICSCDRGSASLSKTDIYCAPSHMIYTLLWHVTVHLYKYMHIHILIHTCARVFDERFLSNSGILL